MLDLFKDYLHLEPAEMQVMSAIIAFPWCIKLLYGLIADNVPIFGSRRRSYLIINGLLAFVCLLPLIP
jgi:BT1 family